MSHLSLVRWIDIPSFRDDRGCLTVVESGRDVPFPINRVYYLHEVRANRAGHAHRDTEQCLVAISGSCTVTLSDGKRSQSFDLNSPSKGLYIMPMLFIQLSSFSPGAVLLVLASSHYDKSRSIRSWDEYINEKQKHEV